MVSNIIDGVLGNSSRINPETLSLDAKNFLKKVREDIRYRNSIDKTFSALTVQAIKQYFQDYGESPLALLPELTTVSYYVISGFRQYIPQITFFLVLGVVIGLLDTTSDQQEIADCLDQLMVAVLTNPIFEFTADERDVVIGMTHQVITYFSTVQFYSGRYGIPVAIIHDSLLEGLKNGLEICNATLDEIQGCATDKLYAADRLLGRLRFYANLCWPLWNITSLGIVRWIKRKTGIELWPVSE